MWVRIRGKQWEWAGMVPHEACDSRGGLLIRYGGPSFFVTPLTCAGIDPQISLTMQKDISCIEKINLSIPGLSSNLNKIVSAN